MFAFNFVVQLSPEGFFGLPENGKIIYPAGTEDLYSPYFDTTTGNFIGHGTLSKYREEPTIIEFTNDEVEIVCQDNHLFIKIIDENPGKAQKRVDEICTRILQMFSINSTIHLEYKILQCTSGDQRCPIEKRISFGQFTVYNLENLKEDLYAAMTLGHLIDERLHKAQAYFSHALILEKLRIDMINEEEYHNKLLASEMLLNFNKSVTTIVGERHEKDYEERYKQFKISTDLWGDVQKLRQLRNDKDIAHYSPSWDKLEIALENLSFAKETAQKVLIKYVDWLHQKEITEA
ncbi:hypothetical protein ABEU97_31645 [Priestia megaterium]